MKETIIKREKYLIAYYPPGPKKCVLSMVPTERTGVWKPPESKVQLDPAQLYQFSKKEEELYNELQAV